MASNGQQNSNMGLVFAAGLFAGYVASLIMPENAQEEAKDKFNKGAKQLRETVNDADPVGKVKSLINGKSGDIMGLYMSTRKSIMDEIKNSKDSWDNVNKKKYSELLKNALDQLSEEQRVPEEQIETLRQYLEDDFQNFRSPSKTKGN